ncbi:60S ribosomal protein L3 [Anaeramoeba flamelloides]|uniref:60S ribosomal protein L3 n=1 Tax=Anaeramoeba flamelloides TaxID=1746091 RepID=A0ABQ8YWK6_9EUKA|nr:60S ribosomal protein L3 [Anaeramoeba flamelloides]
MGHRKFEEPRSGSLGFLPRKRCRKKMGKIRSFPKDKLQGAPHLTGFVGYKAGMTHIVRGVNRPGSDLHKKEIVEAVTIIETPPMIGVGVVGYKRTPKGLKAITTIWAQNISNECKRRFYKNWYKSKQKAFTKYVKTHYEGEGKQLKHKISKLKTHSEVVRLLAHTQTNLIPFKQKKAHLIELQINGGSNIKEKIDFALSKFEQKINVTDVFQTNQVLDTMSISTGKGFKGVIARWGVKRLPRKTHRGLRKVGCIGAWHPANVRWSVARSGQKGYGHRTERNKKIYRIGKSCLTEEGLNNGGTEYDITEKTINPLGGWPKYGLVNHDFLIIKGGVPGTRRRPITLRKTLWHSNKRYVKEEIDLKFIDTASKCGKGIFQTLEEKRKFMGKLKKERLREEAELAKQTKEEMQIEVNEN